MTKMIGIDLGTTNTVVAVMDGPRPRVLDSREGKPQIRSVVGLKRRKSKRDEAASEEILVGDAAVDNWGFAPRDTIVSIKRLMGRGIADDEVQKVSQWAQYKVVPPSNGTRDSVRVLIGGTEYSPIDISAMILKKVKEDAEFRLGEPVTHAVITVPAYFSQIQRDATYKAGLKAGMKVIKILDEPTAAAIAFGTDSGDESPRTILVYDLGGGTFDVSLLMVAGSIFAPLNLEGDMWLGGDNLDQVLVDHALAHVKEDFGIDGTADHRFMAELRKAAQAVKERLSASSSAFLVLSSLLKDDDGNLIDIDLEVKREQYERMILPLIATYKQCSCGQANFAEDDRCANARCGQNIRNVPVRDGKALQIVKRALAEKNQSVEQVDYVLMAGNSTMVPLAQKAIEDLFGRDKVIRKIHPKHSVALGAAIQAAWIGDHVVCHSADPGDPSRECGHVNEPDTSACANCGAKLGLEEHELAETPAKSIEIEIGGRGIEGPRRQAAGQVGGIAAMNYGTQSAGDKFNIFINKGDPYPTEEPKTQIFYTRVPNQRMVSIPIFGGANLEKASANERQGQAFAILPPGLPQDTPVRVQLRLDASSIFKLSAYLADGTDLDPWIVTGEEDAHAIEGIQRVEQIIAKHAQAIAPDGIRKLEEGRDKVFRKMKDRDFDGAIEQVNALERQAEKAASEEQTAGLREQAENAAGYLEFILHQYSWLIPDPNQIYRLNKLVQEVRDEISGGSEAALSQKLRQIEEAVEALPEGVKIFMMLKGTVLSRIQPADPAAAAALLREVDALEDSFKANNPSAAAQMEALVARIGKAMKDAEQKAPSAYKCWNCSHEYLLSERFCPKCRADGWILGEKISSSGSFKSA